MLRAGPGDPKVDKNLCSALSFICSVCLKALSDIQIAVKMVKSSEDGDENPLDRQYRSLCCKLQPLDSSCHEYTVGFHPSQPDWGCFHIILRFFP